MADRPPHLRHNPDVAYVGHALALHERRAWFRHTTWGGLDNDRSTARTRLLEPERYAAQAVREVWFTGCHSDVGGGEIALRWMVGEALRSGPGLWLGPSWAERVRAEPPPPAIHESSSWRWWLSAMMPRVEIINDGVWPRRRPARGDNGARRPQLAVRNGRFAVHPTAADVTP